ncbi:hypothetical protein N0O92_00880 [Alkalihalobacillus sp. MEB130]|uniref:DUF6612 family protein n=1 Tax=Alkalihalobacillus sp. MEB130 TaxID=2976704 RepID=UPI0028DE43AB|nr:DUF6612 family protein [Alkalihalobacillus sp. MEB130]MDT8858763.1 hypothetical protein [Alkalihalobacillus sp. MEB130]
MVHRKKWFLLLSTLFILAACSETQPVVQQEKTEEPQEEEEEKETEPTLTVEDILAKSIGEMQKVESLSSNKEFVQKIHLPDEEPYSTTTSLYSEVIQAPLSLYKKRVSEVPVMGDLITDIYLVEDGVYFKDGLEDVWFTYPEEVTQEIIGNEQTHMTPHEEHLELLARYTDQLTYEEQEDHFVLSFVGSSDVLHAFALELNNMMLDELASEVEEFMSMAEINQLDYTLYIDKETFRQTEWSMTLVLELPLEEDSIKRKINATEKLDQFNEINEIVVPLDVVENAEEFNLYLSEFEDLLEFNLKYTEDEMNF